MARSDHLCYHRIISHRGHRLCRRSIPFSASRKFIAQRLPLQPWSLRPIAQSHIPLWVFSANQGVVIKAKRWA